MGDSFCNGTGPPEYLPAPSSLNPLKSWYIQAQYFFALKCNDGGNVNVHFGEMVPVNEGDTITTSFRYVDATGSSAVQARGKGSDAGGGWQLTISATAPASGSKPRASRVTVPHPFMNSSLSWLQAPFNSTRLGACWEVYGMNKLSDYPSGMSYAIDTVSAKPADYFKDWRMTETASCKFSPKKHGLVTKVLDQGRTQHVDFTISK
jgi:hypothetical protein